jgi:TolB-like protein/predicted metal-dependent HD superfamily phosphohydrolase/Tfp pilus assembly protein PilF
MPSLLPNFEYDIFISYRHNDNRSGWVTEFVNALREELAATIKDQVSVYFDSNPYDGLLETHHVDKSLEHKLKCLIFIPVISQTYCDTKSFAWQHEFCVFNRLAQADKYNRDIKLSSGNVGSRLLPVKIHDLDEEDKAIIENEISGVLRAVEFIYKEPGVNRPLKPADHRNDNQNKTDYQNQINKVANAVKEIILGITKPTSATRVNNPVVVEDADARESIAVLPFRNMSNDSGQEYFSDGITENIIIQLAANKKLRTISRTSVMRYKKSEKSAPEIAAELGVNFILEGGVQTQQNKVRINVQLIDALKDDHVWSKVFNESMDDIFEIQSTVAEVVAKELQASFDSGTDAAAEVVPTKDMEAYNLFLKGRHAFNQWGVEGYRTATDYFKLALAKDPDFQQAYSYLASCYSARMSWNGDLSPEEANKHIDVYLEEAWKRGPQDNDYLTKAFVEFFVDKNFNEAERIFLEVINRNNNNADVLYAYCYLLNMMGRFAEALDCLDRAKILDPLTPASYNYEAITLYLMGKHDKALQVLNEALQLYPAVLRFYDFIARIFLTQQKWEQVKITVLDGLENTNIRPPSLLAYLSAAYARADKLDESKNLLDELIKRSEAQEKGVNIYIVHVYLAMEDVSNAQLWLAKARATNDVDLIWLQVDPLLKELIKSATHSPDFAGAEKHINDLLEREMPALPYHNVSHIQDVLQAALQIAETVQVTEDELNLIRLAALFHDAGFIREAKGHEAHGAAMAKEILPDYGLNEAQIESICSMIMATKLPQTPSNKLDKILCDADLDYLGREDFFEIGARLYQELTAAGAVETEREWNLVQRTFLEGHKYHTAFSLAQREPLKQQHLSEVQAKLKNR